MNYYIFRIDYSKKAYFKENIKKGFLRQGWGAENLSLKNEDGEKRKFEEWIANCPENWKKSEEDKKYLKRKFENLLIMLDIKENDVIVIPKFPERNMITILKIKEKYKFLFEKSVNDYGHVLFIDNKNIKQFTYNSNSQAKFIHSKLGGYRKSLNRVKDRDVKKYIEELLKLESNITNLSIEELIKEAFDENLKKIDNLNAEFFKVRNNEIELLVEKIFKKQGYEIISKNHFDKKGGDVDRIFIKSLPILEDIDDEISSIKVYIQIKMKDYIYYDAEGIHQLEEITKTDKTISDEKVRILKVLVCTGKFDEKIVEEAKEKGIILIDGMQLVLLTLKYL